MATLTCEDLDIAPFSEYAVTLPICIILQLTLLLHTIYHRMKGIQSKIHSIFILLQSIALLWTISEFFRFVIFTQINIGIDNFACPLVAYSAKNAPFLYYLIYLYQILMRLQQSFTNSAFEMSKFSIYTLGASVSMLGVLWIIDFVLTLNQTPCIRPWKAYDIDMELKLCRIPLTSTTVMISQIALGWIFILNITFGVMFCKKLRGILSQDNQRTDIAFKSLIVKMTLLTLTGSISTTICWFLWFSVTNIRGLLVWFDAVLNCVVIGLMFNYNEKWYKRCCKCGIILCFQKCDRSESILDYIINPPDLRKMVGVSSVSAESPQKPTISATVTPGSSITTSPSA